jgi:hypothetical protein
LNTDMCGIFDKVDYIFGISGRSLSHSSSILSKW